MATRLQPNHPTDTAGIAASILDGLLYGNGDAVIGINPATDNYQCVTSLLHMLDDVIQHYQIPTQSCVLTHVTTQIELSTMVCLLILFFNQLPVRRSPMKVLAWVYLF